jgi:hypothetical protein
MDYFQGTPLGLTALAGKKEKAHNMLPYVTRVLQYVKQVLQYVIEGKKLKIRKNKKFVLLCF